MINTHFKPHVSLMGIEYLILSIQLNPGRSQRWHLRRLHIYKHGTEDFHKGGTNCSYFTNPSYRNVLWTDVASHDVVYDCCLPIEGWTSNGEARRSKSAQMHLTRRGWQRSNTIRNKLGLDSIEWGTQPLPDRGAEKIYQTCNTHIG
jgi:hypothetical protein